MARDFAQGEIAPIAAEIDETGEFPYETVKKMGELGLMGLTASADYGGVGADTVSYVLAIEEISKVCASHGVIMSVNNSLVNYGIAEVRHRGAEADASWCRLASGQAIGAYSLTEPQSRLGRGQHAHRGRARRRRLRHQRPQELGHVGSGGGLHRHLRHHRPQRRHQGHHGRGGGGGPAGLRARARRSPSWASGPAPPASSCFDNYRIPVANRLGEEGEGFKIAMTHPRRRAHRHRRPGAWASPRRPSRPAWQYAKERQAFGKAIAELPGHPVHAGRHGHPHRRRAAPHAPRRASPRTPASATPRRRPWPSSTPPRRPAGWRTRRCRSTAAWATRRSCPVERYFRDARITEIYEGTSEIQRLVIARGVLSRMSRAGGRRPGNDAARSSRELRELGARRARAAAPERVQRAARRRQAHRPRAAGPAAGRELLPRAGHVRHPPRPRTSAWPSAATWATAWSPATARSTAAWSSSTRQDFTVFGGSLGRAHADKIVALHGHGHQERRAGDRPERLGRRAHPGGRGQPGRLRRHLPAQHAGQRRGAADLGHHGAVRRRRGLLARPSPTSSSWCKDTSLHVRHRPGRGQDGDPRGRHASRSWAAPTVHSRKSGVAHFAAASEGEAMAVLRSAAVATCRRTTWRTRRTCPPRTTRCAPTRRSTRIVPDEPNKPYDMQEVIRRVVDDGEFLEVHEHFAPEHPGRLRPAGRAQRWASWPSSPRCWPACWTSTPAIKGARFVRFCDCFNIPIITFEDVPGFMPGIDPGARRHHPQRRQAALRLLRGHGAQDHGHHPQGLRRRLRRDELQAHPRRHQPAPGPRPRSPSWGRRAR